MSKAVRTEIITLIGNWAAADSVALGAGQNLLLVQARESVDIRVAPDRGRGRGGSYWTVKDGTAQLFASFNFDERVYISGPAGTVVELMIQEKP